MMITKFDLKYLIGNVERNRICDFVQLKEVVEIDNY